jgi:type I restriction enzyme R subunit
MLYLSRLLMKSIYFGNPTIVLITDRTDLDDQLSGQFANAKHFIGDNNIKSVESRAHLRELLQGRNSGGVFLTTIHKFTEDTQLLTDRSNVICISDEAHRSQTNLNQKITYSENGVKKTFGFAKYLHDSLPNCRISPSDNSCPKVATSSTSSTLPVSAACFRLVASM